ncbi:MAG: hypothetical protein QOI85_1556 [Chloroflexota bacterium]|nr:hypothetical protein [Chloroflexota bacterium]
MHATFRQSGPTDSGTPIRGTFFPGDGAHGGGSIGSMLPKVIGLLVAIAVVRNVARHHGGSSRSSGRREAIKEFHRALHAEDATAQSVEDVKA